MVGKWTARAVKADERVPNGVAEGVVDRSPALVPDRSFVERDRICGGGWRKPAAAEEEAEGEKDRENEGAEKGGED